MMGYLVTYAEKTSLFFRKKPVDNFSERKNALMQQEVLIGMLQKRLSYLVFNVYLVDMEQYKLNHPEENISVLEKV